MSDPQFTNLPVSATVAAFLRSLSGDEAAATIGVPTSAQLAGVVAGLMPRLVSGRQLSANSSVVSGDFGTIVGLGGFTLTPGEVSAGNAAGVSGPGSVVTANQGTLALREGETALLISEDAALVAVSVSRLRDSRRTSGPEAPADPITGDEWFDTGLKRTYVFSDDLWVEQPYSTSLTGFIHGDGSQMDSATPGTYLASAATLVLRGNEGQAAFSGSSVSAVSGTLSSLSDRSGMAGVLGSSDALSSSGVAGVHTGSSAGWGVLGRSDSSSGGVMGVAGSGSGLYGVSTSGTGMRAASLEGDYHAVFGEENSNNRSAIERIRGWLVWFYNVAGTFRKGRLKTASITADREWTLPDVTGTVTITQNSDGSADRLYNGTLSGTLTIPEEDLPGIKETLGISGGVSVSTASVLGALQGDVPEGSLPVSSAMVTDAQVVAQYTDPSFPMLMSRRFANTISVKDFGAAGDSEINYGGGPHYTGGTDDTLAIQRAIYAAAGYTDAMDLDFTNTVPSSNIPTLGIGAGRKTVMIPQGIYTTTRPLIVNEGTQIFGEGASQGVIIVPKPGIGSYFNVIESVYCARMRSSDSFPYTSTDNAYLQGLRLEGFHIKGMDRGLFTRSGTTGTVTEYRHGYQNGDLIELYFYSGEVTVGETTPDNPYMADVIISDVDDDHYSFSIDTGYKTGQWVWSICISAERYPREFYPSPFYSGSVSSPVNALATGTAGNSYFTTSGGTSRVIPIGTRLKFWHNPDYPEVYTLISRMRGSPDTYYVDRPLERSVTSAPLLIGLPKQNGIWVEGGEATEIRNMWVDAMRGCGLFVPHGSPGPLVCGGMYAKNEFGMWLENLSVKVDRVSFDQNKRIIRAGRMKVASCEFNGLKIEDFAGCRSRSVFELGASDDNVPSAYTVIGGNINPGEAHPPGEFREQALFELYHAGLQPNVTRQGFRTIGWGGILARYTHSETGLVTRVIGNVSTNESMMVLPGSAASAYFGQGVLDLHLTNNTNIRLATSRTAGSAGDRVTGAGIMLDTGCRKLEGTATFFRSGTTVTVSYADHPVHVGDYVQLLDPDTNSQLAFANSGGSGSNSISWYNGLFRVVSIAEKNSGNEYTSGSFVINVAADSGPTSGDAWVTVYSYSALHDIRNGVHRFQMPSEQGYGGDGSRAFSFIDVSGNEVAGIRVLATGIGQLWAATSLSVGNNIDHPGMYIRSGTPAVSAITGGTYWEPDERGSLLIKTDSDDPDETLWIRVGTGANGAEGSTREWRQVQTIAP